MESGSSAIPPIYFAIFAIYEPLLCLLGFIGACSDPKTTHDGQAPWPADSPPPDELPRASLVTVYQLAHVCLLIASVNLFLLSAARQHLSSHLELQEKICNALLTPLLIGDVLHIYITLWALGEEERFNFTNWSPMLWTTIGLGLTLLVPRVCWHLGIGRYVHSRDGHRQNTNSPGLVASDSKSCVPIR